jgi:hypothetical protein
MDLGRFPFKFGPGECCCPCWWWTDKFDRGDNTDVGSDWMEEVGNWCIDSHCLVEKYGGGGTSGAKLISTKKVPTGAASEMLVSVKILDPLAGQKFRIYLGLVNEDSTEPYAEFEFLGAVNPNWTVSVHADGQVATKNQLSLAVGTGGYDIYTASACIEPWAWDEETEGNRLCAIKASVISSNEFPWLDSISVPQGRMFGLGHENEDEEVTGARFDDFYVYELVAGTTICETCFCRCDPTEIVRKELTLTFTNATGNITCLESLEDITLTWTWDGAGGYYWYGEKTYSFTGGDHTFKWKLSCGSYNPDTPFAHFTLQMMPGQVCCGTGCDAQNPDPDASQCHGLALVFGPWQAAGLNCFLCDAATPPGASGTYYVTITA